MNVYNNEEMEFYQRCIFWVSL